MSDIKAVKVFLNEFKVKAKLFGILYADRGKNLQALASLEITPKYRDTILLNLDTLNYCEGPLENDQFGNNSMWVFGVEIKNTEIYIKITSYPEKAFCISFHVAEYPLNYPLKNK